MGSMGNGWILPLWDTRIKTVEKYSLTVTLDRKDFMFIILDENTFVHQDIGLIRHDQDFILRRFKDNKEYMFDAETLKLKSVVSVVDDSRLDLVYANIILTEIKHSKGPYVLVSYDAYGRIEAMEVKNASIPKRTGKSFYEYDLERGMLAKTIVGGRETTYVYNYDYSVKYVINEDQSMFIYEYSNMGHMIARRYVVDHREVSGLEYTQREDTMVTVTTTPNNVQSNITFDENGGAILVERPGYLPMKTVTTKEIETSFEGDSIVIQRRFSNGGKHIQLDDGNGDQVDVFFNEFGQMVQFNDGGGNEYHVSINRNGSLDHVIFPDGTNKTYTFSKNGHSVTTQNGRTKKFEYNIKQKLVMRDIGENAVSSFEYNERGSMIKALNEHSKINFTYEDDLPVSVSNNLENVKYTYNAIGLVASISMDNGYLVRYLYDDFGNMKQVLDENKNVSLLTAEYNKRGKIAKKTLGNNASVDYEYDSVSGLLTQITNKFSNGSIASFFKYVYSKRHRRISMTTHEGIWGFDYDAAGQLVYMTSPDGTVTKYTYDNRKNRKTVSVNGVENVAVVNNMNQYTKYGDTEFEYDKNGNLIKKKNGTSLSTYEFNEDNQLTGFSSNGQKCVLTYDALGNLYLKQCNGTKTRYSVDPFGIHGANILKQTIESGSNKEEIYFYHGGEQIGLVAMTNGTDMSYFLFDPVGSVVGILSSQGEFLNKYQLDPFGEVLEVSVNVHSPFTFVGQWGVMQLQEMPEMFFMRSRVYDSSIGRFISIDTYGLKAKSKNFYAYCFNNPVHFNDPEGTCPICWVAGFGALEGAINYYMDTRDGSFTWGGAAGAIAHGAVDGALGSLKKWKTIARAVKGGINYAYEHRNGGFTGEGMALAIARGALDGHIPNRTPFKETLVDATFDGLESLFEHGFKEGIKDFANGLLGGLMGSIRDKIDERFPGNEFWSPFSKKIMDAAEKYGEQAISDVVDWIVSLDPNDIIGPPGYGAARFVRKDATLAYKIRFENDENATAPAQRVYIEHKYSTHIDHRSFLMGYFGFGNLIKTVPSGTRHFQVSLNVTSELGVYVRVVAGLDQVNQMVFWEFQALDPETGEAPTNPSVGFLPPNNGSSGQGYVTFSMKPKKDTPHLATIHTNASIYFDENEPIDAPDVFNTIDDTAPRSEVSVVKETLTSGSVTFSLNSSDSGAGVKHVDLFLEQDNGYLLFRGGVKETTVVLSLEPGNVYSIVPIAEDHVGNRHILENIAQEFKIEVEYVAEAGVCNCSGRGNCSVSSTICICYEGYYGEWCNTTERPLEPPVLELRTSSGPSSEPIPLYISARNVSGSIESMTISVKGFPEDTLFSKGNMRENNTLVLLSDEFGTINMTTPEKFSGNVTLNIEVTQTLQIRKISRNGLLLVRIYPDISDVLIQVYGCLKEVDNETVAELSVTLLTDNSPTPVSYTMMVTLPNWTSMSTGTFLGDGVYKIEDTSSKHLVYLHGHSEPFNGTIAVSIEQSADILKSQFSISDFCSQGCIGLYYGVNCSMKCLCNDEHYASCNSINGNCSCIEGWTGAQCDVDIDECALNKSICIDQANTDCQNKHDGFDCLCLVGYYLVNGTCVENQAVETTTTDPDEKKGEKITNVEIRIDIEIPSADNLNTSITSDKYKREASGLLNTYYNRAMGTAFLRVDILSLRSGSLIVNHNVVTQNTDDASQQLVLAINGLTKDNNLQFLGINITITEVIIEDVKVNKDDKDPQISLCRSYAVINPCDHNSSCVLVDNIPTCRVTPTEKGTGVSLQTVLVIAISGSAALLLLILVVGIIIAVRRRNKKRPRDANNPEYTETADSTHVHRSRQAAYRNPAYIEVDDFKS